MTKSLPLQGALLAALMVAASGCADHPSTAASNQWSPTSEATLLQAASNLGYSPAVVDGKTIFCKGEEATGTMIPKQHCLSEDALRNMAQAQGQTIQDMRQDAAPRSAGRPGGPG